MIVFDLRTFSFVFILLICPAVLRGNPSGADFSFEKRDFASAIVQYERDRDAAREEKSRDAWKRITAQIVRCAKALGDDDRAAQEFFLLCRVDPQTPPIDCIPLPWFTPLTVSPVPKAIEKTAEDWLDPIQNKTPGQAGTLLAAGILSVSSDGAKRIRGLNLLRDIAATLEVESGEKAGNRTAEPSIQRQAALLASCLLWKQRIPMLQKPTDAEPFRRTLEQLPEPFRGGPYFLLGQANRQTGDLETAILCWMRIPILYPNEKTLGSESLRETAKALEKLGRIDQAERLKKEIP